VHGAVPPELEDELLEDEELLELEDELLEDDELLELEEELLEDELLELEEELLDDEELLELEEELLEEDEDDDELELEEEPVLKSHARSSATPGSLIIVPIPPSSRGNARKSSPGPSAPASLYEIAEPTNDGPTAS
jgi:hypothetical protein